MNNYIKHLQELSNPRTFERKKDYINYNLSTYLKTIGFKNIKALEMGPGLCEFEDYLNERGVFNIDVIDNDRSILAYASKKYKINKYLLIGDFKTADGRLGNYNFILLMQVLEHLPSDKYATTLKVLYKHLEKNGYLIIIVPNANNPLGLVERYADLQHTSAFTEQSLKDLVNLANIENYRVEIKGYEIPPYTFINALRIFLQKILHTVLIFIMIINGGTYFKTMTPNIMMVIRKNI